MASLNFKHKTHGFQRKRSPTTLIIAAIIIIAIAVVVLLSLGGVNKISSSQTFTIKQGSSLQFTLPSSQSTFSIYLNNATTSSAGLLVSQSPVLSSTIVSFLINNGSTLNISTEGLSTANLQIKLLSSNSTYAKLQLTPVPSGLTIPTSSFVINSQPSPIPKSSITPAQSTISTTTSIQSSTAPKTSQQSTVPTTTTTTPSISQSIITEANNSYIGTLVANLNILYAEESQCTSSIYNQTFISYVHQQPIGPFSYQNVSTVTPKSILTKITGPFSYGYLVNYTSNSDSKLTSGLAISMELNSTTGVISNVKFSGIFEGQNYTDIHNSYTFQSGIGNSCAALIPYS
ncbi:MAG: hypothetical protein QXD23_00335 [Candidatus Micrarchaeaceae archaeon]